MADATRDVSKPRDERAHAADGADERDGSEREGDGGDGGVDAEGPGRLRVAAVKAGIAGLNHELQERHGHERRLAEEGGGMHGQERPAAVPECQCRHGRLCYSSSCIDTPVHCVVHCGITV